MGGLNIVLWRTEEGEVSTQGSQRTEAGSERKGKPRNPHAAWTPSPAVLRRKLA